MDATKVTTGVRRTLGGVFCASAGTTLPTDASTALATAFKDQGYISEDGVTKSYSNDIQEIKEWGGATVLVVRTEKTITFALKEIETLNEDAIKTVYGAENVEGTIASGLTITETDDQPEEMVWVIDMVASDGTLERVVIPRGVITDRGDEVYKRDEAVGYDITITALPDTTGNKVYTHIKEA